MKPRKKYADGEIITAIQEGSDIEDPVHYLYATQFDSIAHFIRKNKGSQADAEDLFQEVIVVFIELIRQGKFQEKSSIKTFLYSIARNLWLNELRKRNRAMLRDTEYYASNAALEENVNTYIIKKESNNQIFQLMDKLGDTCKQILTYYYYHNFSMKEILERMDYQSEQVVRNKKYKCMKQLMELLDDNQAIKLSLKDALLYGN